VNSDNSYLTCFYSNKRAHVANTLYPIETNNDEEAKILCLSLNSTSTLLQLCRLKSETQMNWGHVGKEDWLITKQLNPNKLTDQEKDELLMLFDNISKNSFSSLKNQLNEGSIERKKIDEAILKILGFDSKKIQKILLSLYQVTYSLIISMGNTN